jgi:murein DD-endopeptidase MepM/ murein hydrolase activator NlpD
MLKNSVRNRMNSTKKSVCYLLVLIFILLVIAGCEERMKKDKNDQVFDDPNSFQYTNSEDSEFQDLLTPLYYLAQDTDMFREDLNKFIFFARQVPFHHPFNNGSTNTINYSVPTNGMFCSEKGKGQDIQYHPAVDIHFDDDQTNVTLFATHDGIVKTEKDAEKYRHYLSITKDITDDEGQILGKLVTIYAHLDLDLDQDSSLFLNGQSVQAGDIISQHLYEGTVGGPHLHLEIRYYRNSDDGDEEFYGSGTGPNANPEFTTPSAGIWSYGYWNPDVGYGFADPRNHGLIFYEE